MLWWGRSPSGLFRQRWRPWAGSASALPCACAAKTPWRSSATCDKPSSGAGRARARPTPARPEFRSTRPGPRRTPGAGVRPQRSGRYPLPSAPCCVRRWSHPGGGAGAAATRRGRRRAAPAAGPGRAPAAAPGTAPAGARGAPRRTPATRTGPRARTGRGVTPTQAASGAGSRCPGRRGSRSPTLARSAAWTSTSRPWRAGWTCGPRASSRGCRRSSPRSSCGLCLTRLSEASTTAWFFQLFLSAETTPTSCLSISRALRASSPSTAPSTGTPGTAGGWRPTPSAYRRSATPRSRGRRR
mmetsp:Transcript_6030/g.14588  ORF Transcript_6030/g.14588 Transcript_6030/m.14588 type:complete len:299 (+) Transcript_6030:369-1265(+)